MHRYTFRDTREGAAISNMGAADSLCLVFHNRYLELLVTRNPPNLRKSTHSIVLCS